MGCEPLLKLPCTLTVSSSFPLRVRNKSRIVLPLASNLEILLLLYQNLLSTLIKFAVTRRWKGLQVFVRHDQNSKPFHQTGNLINQKEFHSVGIIAMTETNL